MAGMGHRHDGLGRAGCYRTKSGQAVGAHCRAGWGWAEQPTRTAGRGMAGPGSRRTLFGGAGRGQGRRGQAGRGAVGARQGGARWLVRGRGKPGEVRSGLGEAEPGSRRVAEASRGQVGVGRGVAGWARLGQSQGGRCVGSGEPRWSVRGEQAAGRIRAGRAGKNKETIWIHKLGTYVPRLL
jgi:hypothetical protein